MQACLRSAADAILACGVPAAAGNSGGHRGGADRLTCWFAVAARSRREETRLRLRASWWCSAGRW